MAIALSIIAVLLALGSGIMTFVLLLRVADLADKLDK